MTNDRENSQQNEPQNESAKNISIGRNKQFNELSEISLEERMAAADRIGVPVDDVVDAAETGAMGGPDDSVAGPEDRVEEESTGERTDR